MNFSAWSIRNPVAPILGFVLLMFLGWQSFNTLSITRFPNVDLPIVSVAVVQSGAAPAELESQITREVEDAITGIAGVKNIRSTVVESVSTTLIEFHMDVVADKALQEVKDAVERIRGDLPAEAEAPIVTQIDIMGQAILTYAVSNPAMTLAELSWFVDDVIKGELQGRPGIGSVSRYGGADREIRVELDPVRLDSLGITAAAVNAQLAATNANMGAGRTEIGSGEQAIRTLGDAGSVEQLAATTIALPSGRSVRLSDLGTVTDTVADLRSFSRYDGQTVVTFAVYRGKGASEVSVFDLVSERLDVIRAAHPEMTITMIDDQVAYTKGNYKSAIHTLMEGALLAILVVMAFLRNWRATLITAVALPLSAIPTFWVMDMLGFSLNLITLLGITLATGILVDDAIVEIENIARHMRMGKSPYRASIDAADEIGLAVVATAFTIVAVFVPVSFMPGIVGQYFQQFGMTVAIAVLFSLLVARLITPMMAAYLMRASDALHEEPKDGFLMRGYLAFVKVTLRARYLTMLAAVGVLWVSFNAMLSVPGNFMPPEDVGRIPISIELPPGATLNETEVTTNAVYDAIRDIDGVAHVFVLGGSSPTGGLDLRRATVTVLLDPIDLSLGRRLSDIGALIPVIGPHLPFKPNEDRLVSQFEVQAQIIDRLAGIPDIRAFVLNDRGERDIAYSILSSDEAALGLAVARMEDALRGEPLLAAVSSEGALPRPEVQITPRADEAARLGVTTAAISQAIRVATVGEVDAALTKISIDNRQIPVRVRLSDAARTDLDRIGALRVPTGTGGTVPLSAVADIAIAEGPSVINRLNRDRIVTIGANLPDGVVLGVATARFLEIADAVELPPGVRIAESGDAELQQELNTGFANAMVLGLMLVLTVLILLFKSVIQPFTILLSLPLAIGGVALSLILLNNPISIAVLIGILMLMGIVTKNAILLVDFAIEMRHRGLDRFSAIVEAGHKRARPIIMTSIAMSAGMLPSALGVGEGGAFRAPMAQAVIGGILVSTVLSLVIVPSFFLIMDDLGNLLGRFFGLFIGPKEEEPEAPDAHVLASGIADQQQELATLKSRLAQLEAAATQPIRRGGPTLHVAE